MGFCPFSAFSSSKRRTTRSFETRSPPRPISLATSASGGRPASTSEGICSQPRYLEFAVSQASESKAKFRGLAAVCFSSLERIFLGDALFDPGTLAFVARCPHPSLLGRRSVATVSRSFYPGCPKDAFRYGRRSASVLSPAGSEAPAVSARTTQPWRRSPPPLGGWPS
jgi:hypothetical protein